MKRQSPSFFTIAKADYLVLVGVILTVVGVGFFLCAWLAPQVLEVLTNRKSGLQTWGFVACLLSVIGMPLALLRWRSVARLFAQGEECEGQVMSVWFHRDRGRVEVRYTYQGRELTGGVAVARNASTQALHEGQHVQLLVDPERPTTLLLPDLFR